MGQGVSSGYLVSSAPTLSQKQLHELPIEIMTLQALGKVATPSIAGSTDGMQPRFLETVNSWGLAAEVREDRPLIEKTAIYKDGKKILFYRLHQSDSRYRGLDIITQG